MNIWSFHCMSQSHFHFMWLCRSSTYSGITLHLAGYGLPEHRIKISLLFTHTRLRHRKVNTQSATDILQTRLTRLSETKFSTTRTCGTQSPENSTELPKWTLVMINRNMYCTKWRFHTRSRTKMASGLVLSTWGRSSNCYRPELWSGEDRGHGTVRRYLAGNRGGK